MAMVSRAHFSAEKWKPGECFELTVMLPRGFDPSPATVRPRMAPGSTIEVHWERDAVSGVPGEKMLVRGWALSPSNGAGRDLIALDIIHPSFTGTVVKEIFILPANINGPEFFTFCGHPNDSIQLCPLPGFDCQWEFRNEGVKLGWFDHPQDSRCTFRATTPGFNAIQLRVAGTVVWWKEIWVLPIVTREEWGAAPPKPHSQTISGFEHLTLHHTSNTGTGMSEMRRIQKLHMSLFPYNFFGGKNFDDIGYHFIVDKDGRVYEGRRLESAPGAFRGPYTKGEHVGANNTVAGIGVCLMGDYEATEGNEALSFLHQQRLERVLAALCIRYRIHHSQISYHQMLAVGSGASLCPGSNVIPKIPYIIDSVANYTQ
jgi:hypothetical protein